MTSKAVNVPTNTKIKESDINGKLQLYGIYTGACPRAAPLRAPSTMTHDLH